MSQKGKVSIGYGSVASGFVTISKGKRSYSPAAVFGERIRIGNAPAALEFIPTKVRKLSQTHPLEVDLLRVVSIQEPGTHSTAPSLFGQTASAHRTHVLQRVADHLPA